MKLLIKIFSQTTYIILLVSSGIFLYTTYCWKNQSIQNINSYESSIFRTNILQFENKTSLSDNQKQNADNEMRPQIVTYAFRQVFHDSAVLYLDGKMIYNGTVYEFDVKKLRELCESCLLYTSTVMDNGSMCTVGNDGIKAVSLKILLSGTEFIELISSGKLGDLLFSHIFLQPVDKLHHCNAIFEVGSLFILDFGFIFDGFWEKGQIFTVQDRYRLWNTADQPRCV